MVESSALIAATSVSDALLPPFCLSGMVDCKAECGAFSATVAAWELRANDRYVLCSLYKRPNVTSVELIIFLSYPGSSSGRSRGACS